jgi:DNA integrity scanning protein DisA with diadenylate cyclase activity
MKIYSNIDDDLLELGEISFLINDVEELVKLKEFMEKCILDMNNNTEFNHEHFSDYLNNKQSDEMPEVIVCK